jgi:NAD(P)-dependent dehydrogenase (short-subunit alcohol dehydrogenase family)
MVKPFLGLTDEDWHGLLAVNLHGYFYGYRAAIRQMMAQGGRGRVINVTSIVDVQPISEMAVYIDGGRHPKLVSATALGPGNLRWPAGPPASADRADLLHGQGHGRVFVEVSPRRQALHQLTQVLLGGFGLSAAQVGQEGVLDDSALALASGNA